jgi:hypothetical protein
LEVTGKKLWIPDLSNGKSMAWKRRKEVELKQGEVAAETLKNTWQPSVNEEKMSRKSFRF